MSYIISMINIFNLNKSRDEREINRFTTYRKILEKCHRRIQINSDKKVTHCIFTIPKISIQGINVTINVVPHWGVPPHSSVVIEILIR